MKVTNLNLIVSGSSPDKWRISYHTEIQPDLKYIGYNQSFVKELAKPTHSEKLQKIDRKNLLLEKLRLVEEQN